MGMIFNLLFREQGISDVSKAGTACGFRHAGEGMQFKACMSMQVKICRLQHAGYNAEVKVCRLWHAG